MERTDANGKGDGNGPYWTWSTGDPSAADPAKRAPRPMDPARAKIRDGMIKRRVLEEYAEFLSAALRQSLMEDASLFNSHIF